GGSEQAGHIGVRARCFCSGDSRCDLQRTAVRLHIARANCRLSVDAALRTLRIGIQGLYQSGFPAASAAFYYGGIYPARPGQTAAVHADTACDAVGEVRMDAVPPVMTDAQAAGDPHEGVE